MSNKKTLVMITGVSWSGKSTLLNMMVERNKFKQPLHFTTRQPRSDAELDEYCFIDRESFLKKMENGDFCDWIFYNGNYYGITAFFDFTKPHVMLLDPIGKAMVDKFCKMNWIESLSLFIDIDENTMVERLWMKRREKMNVIEERKKDFLYFNPKGYDYIIDWRDTAEIVYRHVNNILKTNGF